MNDRTPPSREKKRKPAAFFLFLSVVLVSMPFLAVPQRASAIPVEDIILENKAAADTIWSKITDGLVEGASVALVSGINYMVSQMAYSAAVALTSSCPGQVACWDTKAWVAGRNQAFLGAVGETIGTLSQQLGFQNALCYPPQISLNLKVGLLQSYGPNAPKCDWNRIREQYGEIIQSLSTGQVFNALKPTLSPGGAPLSAGLKLFTDTQLQANLVERDYVMERIATAAAGGGFSDIRDPVSGRVLSPAAVTKAEFQAMRDRQEKDPQQFSTLAAANQIASRAVGSVVLNGVQVFVTTLVSRLWNQFWKGLLTAEEAVSLQPDFIFSPDAYLTTPGQATAEHSLTRVLAPPPRETGVIDPLLEFSVCPSGTTRGPFNCVIDTQFANAVRVADATPLTVREAMDKGLLHADWPLISVEDVTRDQDPFCYTYAYCESNLKKLRASRIIPIGWEIAASLAKPGAAPIRLRDVVDGFDDCNDDGQRDSGHPFCHLVDPDWVLKAPPTQCRAEATGPTLVSSDTSARLNICVDKRTCLQQDDRGNCVGGWGYCQRERDVWRFDADSCPAYYNSCRTFSRDDGPNVSYLLNTIDFGECNADNVGCNQYATTRNAVICQTTTCTAGDGQTCTAGCTIEAGESSCASKTVQCTSVTACLDPNGCDVGCQVADGQKGCTTVVGDQTDVTDDWQQYPSRFFTGDAQPCSPDDDGCSALVPLEPGQSLNIVPSGSVETREDADGDGLLDAPAGWVLPAGDVPQGATGYVNSDPADAIQGAYSLYLDSGASGTGTCTKSCSDDGGCSCTTSDGHGCLVPQNASSCTYSKDSVGTVVPLEEGITYTMSAIFRSADGGPATGKMRIIFNGPDGLGVSVRDGDVSTVSSFSTRIPLYETDGPDLDTLPDVNPCTVTSNGISFDFTTSSATSTVSEVRAACTFTVRDSLDILSGDLVISAGASDAWVDGVQLEAGALTPFHDGYNTDAKVSVKVAPDYLGCTGEPTDREECNNYAFMCREDEVGCDGYTPLNGDPTVPGIVGPQDRCPSECVGYDVFFQEPTDFDVPTQPEYFIPSTATQCSRSDAGCTEFTNIETEQAMYFSKLRICQKPDAEDTRTYYSWEGSDTSGYQLRVWDLKSTGSTVDSTAPSDSTSAFDVCVNADGTSCDAGYAPCVLLDSNDPTSCIDSPYSSGSPEEASGWCTRQDIDNGDLDCREFYDSDGNRHYRRLSRTVIATADCAGMRISQSTEAECRIFNGTWDPARGDCVYHASPSASASCAAEYAGCRAYKGNASTNVRTVVTEDFEAGVDQWSGSGVSSPDAATVGGKSLKIPASGSGAVNLGLNGQVKSGRTYTVSFWARGTGTLNAGFVDGTPETCTLDSACTDANGCTCVTDSGMYCNVNQSSDSCTVSTWKSAQTTLDPSQQELPAPFGYDAGGTTPSGAAYGAGAALTPEWLQYTMGPIAVTDANFGPDFAPVDFRIERGGSGDAYVDNVVIKEVQDSIYVVRDSWNTPRSCDSTAEGAYSPQEMLGCKAYVDTQNASQTLRSFSRICREEAISCKAYSHTGNTPDWTGYRTFNAVCRLGRVCTGAPGQPNCPCDYVDTAVSGFPGRAVHPDVCRVAIGETECRFTFDGYDHTGSAVQYPDRLYSPADRPMFLAVHTKDYCLDDAIGCRVMGEAQPVYERDCRLPEGQTCSNDTCECQDEASGLTCTIGSGGNRCTISLDTAEIGSWKEFAAIDDPSLYDTNLCLQSAVGCKAYTATDGTYYFKDPGTRTCEWRENVNVDGKRMNGWFRSSAAGALFPCNPELIENGRTLRIAKNSDVSCDLGSKCVSGSNTGASCVNDAQCGRSGKCEAVLCNQATGCSCSAPDGRVCLVAQGRNACGFQGWAGSCTASYDRCEEFIDPSDTSIDQPDGRKYYYLENERLDTTSCSGTVSQQQSCVLLRKTSDTNLTYQSAATYLRSEQDYGGKVAPVNCNVDGQKNDRCENRCVSIPNGHCSNAPLIDCTSFDNGSSNGCPAGTGSCVGDLVFTSACTDTRDSTDCQRNIGETCVDPSLPKYGGRTDLQGNDSNVIIHVRRDRECAAWLECAQYQSFFSEAEGRWMRVCMDFGTCVENQRIGENLSCVNFSRVDPEYLTPDVYASRDTSWRGNDYSGYSLVDRYQPELLEPVKARQGVCVRAGSVSSRPAGCENPDECSCDVPGDCDSGYSCRAMSGVCMGGDRDNKGCDLNSDCPSGFCTQNELATTRYGVVLSLCDGGSKAGQSCTDDVECGGGSCVTSCTDHCPKDVTGAEGSCINNRCVYDFRGGKLYTQDLRNAPQCRGYPEESAPYDESVLDTGNSEKYDQFGRAQVFKTSFSGANTCMEGNYCECSYEKVEYGNSAAVRYYSVNNPQYVQPDGTGADRLATGIPLGICVGGPYDGMKCDPNDQTDAGDVCIKAEGGTCARRSLRTVARGWAGFCIDPDYSININGARDEYNCNLWLPVDQLTGLTDAWNYYPEAGFVSDQDQLLYCQVAAGKSQNGQVWRGGVSANEALVTYSNGADDYKVEVYGRAGGTNGERATENAGSNGFYDSTTHPIAYKGRIHESQVIGFRVEVQATCKARGFFGTVASGIGATLGGAEGFLIGSYLEDSLSRSQAPTQVCSGTEFQCSSDDQCKNDSFQYCEYEPGRACSSTSDCYYNIDDESPPADRSICKTPDEITANPDGNAQCVYAGPCVTQKLPAANQRCIGEGPTTFFIPAPDDQGTSTDERWLAAIDWKPNRKPDSGLLLGTEYPANDPNHGPHIAKDGEFSYCVNYLKSNANPDGSGNVAKYTENNDGPERRCFGIQVNFDSSGLLNQVEYVAMHGDDSDFTCRPRFFVNLYAVLAEQCTDIARTYGPGNSWGTNVAWTDRLWDNAQNGSTPGTKLPYDKFHLSNRFSWPYPSAEPNTSVSTSMWPYGRITAEVQSSTDSGNLTFAPAQTNPDAIYNKILTVGASEGGSVKTGVKVVRDQLNVDPVQEQYHHVVWNAPDVISGIPFACRGDCGEAGSGPILISSARNAGSNARQTGEINLSAVFATAWRLWSADPNGNIIGNLSKDMSNRTYAPQAGFNDGQAGVAWDRREFNLSAGDAPVIAGARTASGNCRSEGECEEGPPGSLAVNGALNGNVTFSGGYGQAIIAFYAYADKNRMPIRRKVVDFGDGTVISTTGLFKNHRGVTYDPTTGEFSSICDNSDFGKSTQACDPHYFQETRVYTCSEPLAAAMPACDEANPIYPCNDSGICVYKPRVQILDNWGGCNGSCSGQNTPGGELCFNRDLTDQAVDIDDPQNECHLLDEPEETAVGGKRYRPANERRPWTEFGGEIRVCPGTCPE